MLGLAEAADDTVWLAQEPGPPILKCVPLGWEVKMTRQGNEAEGGRNEDCDAWTMKKAERESRGEEKPERRS